MQITAQMVKELRDQTGAGMMDCKSALAETDGDLKAAVDVLRTKGIAKAAKKAGRSTSEGLVGHYIHAGGKIGVLVEVNCETDFVARTDAFGELVKDIAMHVAAADPRALFVNRDEVDQDVLERERKIFRDQAIESGKPENVIDRIVDGKIEKFYSESVLLEQAFVKDPDKKVGELLAEAIGALGENMQIRRFVRFQLGEEG
jgi:elongation factor Ts